MASRNHINRLFEQLLKQENLSTTWKDIILPYIFKVSEKVIIFFVFQRACINSVLISQLDFVFSYWHNISNYVQFNFQVVPDVRRDDMDIRRYVWITKVAGGQKTDCHFVSGVVFRKNVAHKRMSGTFTSPAILMLSCAIEYQVGNT